MIPHKRPTLDVARRNLLVAGGAFAVTRALGGAGAWAQAAPSGDYYSAAFLEDLFSGNSEDIPPANAAARLTMQSYHDIIDLLKSGITTVHWPDRADAPDYAHLETDLSNRPFALDGAAMQRLADANAFTGDLGGVQGKVLFGLRGCKLAPGQTSSSGASVQLVESVPDHFTHQCIMGVWDTKSGEISVFPGSTVPDAAYVYAQYSGEEGANMMPTGRYLYRVGTHAWKKPSSRQPGAWRQGRSWPVRRAMTLDATHNLSYTHAAVWDVPDNICGTRAMTGNNLHAGVLDQWTGGVHFSSAGCQTVAGRYEPRGAVPTGPFNGFRVAAGLPELPVLADIVGPDGATHTVSTPEDGRAYTYLLFTGADARLASVRRGRTVARRLRYGSRGPAVMQLQTALIAAIDPCIGADGAMGMQAVAALVKYQRQNNLRVDGIATPELLSKLGVSL